MRLSKEQYRLDACYLAIDVGLLALVLKVFHAAHSLYDELGVLCLGKVDRQTVVGFNLDARLIFVQLADGLHTHLGRGHVGLVNLIAYHANDQTVEQG